LRAIIGQPSALIGVPFDRPVVGYGGKTINTLRLWAAAAHDYFNFQEFSSGDFVGALAETLEAESLTRVLYPDDHTSMGQGLRFVQEYFLVACSLADLVRRFLNQHRLAHPSRQSCHSAQRYASDDGGAGVDADFAR
jgi:starch phosphorylase